MHFFFFPACCRSVRLVYALFGEIRNKYKKEGGKEGEKRGGKDMRFMAVKLAGLVYALYDAKSEARRLV